MLTLVAAVLAAAMAAALTGIYRRYAISRHILDHPTERSSHTAPTPRGGGIAIVAATLLGLLAAVWTGRMDLPRAAGLTAGGLLVAGAGWWDDRWGLAARWRFAAHLAASGIAVAALGAPAALPAGGWTVELGWMAAPLSVIGLTTLVNLTNFMDGIDGIAASEGAFVASGVALAGGACALPAAVLAGACAGFLLWNRPPARIFMGDVGSGFLGFMMGAFILAGAAEAPAGFWTLAILPATFVVDGSTTLLRRFFTRQEWTAPHRSHAYQHAAQRWGHGPVTAAFLCLNLVWVAPLSWAAGRQAPAGPLIAAICCAPLLALALWQRAGVSGWKPKRQERPCL